jgi:hypothetical protein
MPDDDSVKFESVIRRSEELLDALSSDERSGLIGRPTLLAANELRRSLAAFFQLIDGSPLVRHARHELSLWANLNEPAQAAFVSHLVRVVSVYADGLPGDGPTDAMVETLARLLRLQPLSEGEDDADERSETRPHHGAEESRPS